MAPRPRPAKNVSAASKSSGSVMRCTSAILTAVSAGFASVLSRGLAPHSQSDSDNREDDHFWIARMPSHKRHGPHRGGGGHQPPPQPDVANEVAEHAAAALQEGKKPGLNITDLKEMTIQHLTQVAKDL